MTYEIKTNNEKYHDNFLFKPLDVQAKEILETYSGKKIDYRIEYTRLYFIIGNVEFEVSVKSTIRIQLSSVKVQGIAIRTNNTDYNISMPAATDLSARLSKFFKNLSKLETQLVELSNLYDEYKNVCSAVEGNKLKNYLSQNFVSDICCVSMNKLENDDFLSKRGDMFHLDKTDKRLYYRVSLGFYKDDNVYKLKNIGAGKIFSYFDKRVYSDDTAGLTKLINDATELERLINDALIDNPIIVKYLDLKFEVINILKKM
jgi:hypothetical protein